MRWAGHVARMGRIEVYRRFLWGNLERNRPRRRWEDDIKIHLREVRWRSMDWIAVTQDKARWRTLVNAVLNLRVP